MKRWIALLLMVLAAGMATGQRLTDSVWRTDVKTVLLYGGMQGDDPQTAPPVPVLTLGEEARLALEFDVLGTESARLHWRLQHCDRHWQPDGLAPEEFINGFAEGAVEDYDFSFTTLTEYVHYRCLVPDQYAAFTHSGNYVLTVWAEGRKGKEEVLLTRRFCVSEQSSDIKAELTQPYNGVNVDRRQEVDVTVGVNERPERIAVVVQQNGRTDNQRELEFSGLKGGSLNYARRPCNIFDGGNTFRYFDCSNLRSPMYNVLRVDRYGGEQMVMLRPEEDRSRKHYLSETTLNGGMKVNVWDRKNPSIEADYVWVNITMPMAQPILDGNIYVVGALTDWKVDSTSLMEYNPKLKAYTKRLHLKQGYYAYQLLFGKTQYAVGESKTARLEGDHQETPNRYTVYVYHRTPADRADRLIAVRSFIATR